MTTRRDDLRVDLIAVDYWGARGLGPSTATVDRMLPLIDAYVAPYADALRDLVGDHCPSHQPGEEPGCPTCTALALLAEEVSTP